MPTSDEGAALADVGRVFDGLVGVGVHVLSDPVTADDLRSRAAASGWAALTADASGGKAAVLDELAASGRFPDWFGRNWDALSDCLADLSWLPAAGYVVLIEGWEVFETAAPRDAAVARAVLRHAATEWSARGTPFVALTR